ncbi:MAG: LysM peptidoglycan-binding domain-containing protein [Betaproteobacteria bacterium]|nr:LysM peptidoglycan-binding domain-containing protein [Betaproteobacteria bacterium]
MKFWIPLLIVFCMAAFIWPAGMAGATGDTVTVQQGQSLSAIAAQHKVSVAQLCQWNKLSSPDKVRVGQKLYIRSPEAGSAVGNAPAASAPAEPVPPPAKDVRQAKKPTPESTTAASGAVEMRAPDGVPEKVRLELADVGRTLVNNAARNIMPNIKAKAVAPGGSDGYVASYTEVDASNIRTEVLPSSESGKYVGSIRYVENQYECPGKSKADALQAECHVVKSRRMNELIRYEKGKWSY